MASFDGSAPIVVMVLVAVVIPCAAAVMVVVPGRYVDVNVAVACDLPVGISIVVCILPIFSLDEDS